jgi:hypothetical protein
MKGDLLPILHLLYPLGVGRYMFSLEKIYFLIFIVDMMDTLIRISFLGGNLSCTFVCSVGC